MSWTRIAEVGLNLPCMKRGRARTVADPRLSMPTFHMDATLSYGLPRVNQSGTLLEGIALWGELKPLLTQEAAG
jgi:cytosine deaminase